MGTYRNPDIIQDPLAKALSDTSKKVGEAAAGYITSVENQKKLAQLKKNALNKEMYGINQAVNSIPSSADVKFDERFQTLLKTELNKVNQLGLNSLQTGDNTEYLKAKSSFESLVKQMPSLISNIDNQAKQLDEKGVNMVLDNTDANYVEFLDNWNNKDGSGIIPKIKNGKLIMDYNGFNVNTGTVLKNVENGGGLSFVESPDKVMQTMWKAAAGNNYEKFKELRTRINKGETITSRKEIQDYTEANNRIKADLTGVDENGNPIENWVDPFQSEYDQNNWQWFTQGKREVYTGTPEQKKELRNLMVDDIMKTYAAPDEVIQSSTSTDTSEIEKDRRNLVALQDASVRINTQSTLEGKGKMMLEELTKVGVKDVNKKFEIDKNTGELRYIGKVVKDPVTKEMKQIEGEVAIDLSNTTLSEIQEFLNSQATQDKLSSSDLKRVRGEKTPWP